MDIKKQLRGAFAHKIRLTMEKLLGNDGSAMDDREPCFPDKERSDSLLGNVRAVGFHSRFVGVLCSAFPLISLSYLISYGGRCGEHSCFSERARRTGSGR